MDSRATGESIEPNLINSEFDQWIRRCGFSLSTLWNWSGGVVRWLRKLTKEQDRKGDGRYVLRMYSRDVKSSGEKKECFHKAIAIYETSGSHEPVTTWKGRCPDIVTIVCSTKMTNVILPSPFWGERLALPWLWKHCSREAYAGFIIRTCQRLFYKEILRCTGYQSKSFETFVLWIGY